MSTIRTVKNKDYTTINNTVLNDVALTWKAKGLAAYLLSKPDTWKIQRDHLATQAEDGISAVRSALKELEQFGYLLRQKTKNDKGLFEWEYVLYEIPQNREPLKKKQGNRQKKAKEPVAENQPMEPSAENPPVDNPPAENPPADNRTLVSTNIVSTDQASTEKAPSARAEAAPPDPTPPAPAAEVLPADPPKPLRLANDSYDMPIVSGNGPSPSSGRPPSRPAAKLKSRYFDHRKTDLDGYIPAGTGINAVEIYYEWHTVADHRLTMPNQDDIMRVVADLDRWRAAVKAWSQAGHRPSNVKGMLDWYRDPSRYAPPPPRTPTAGATFGLAAYAEKERKQYEADFGPDPELTPEEEERIWAHKRQLAEQDRLANTNGAGT